jgi:hypothetical protein
MNYTRGEKATRNISNIIHNRNERNSPKYIMEDIYQSRRCVYPDDPPEKAQSSPHNGYYDGSGRWFFDFNENWFSLPVQNKAIGLRRIDTRPNAYDFDFCYNMHRYRKPPDPAPEEDVLISALTHIYINCEWTIDQALSTICQTVNNSIIDDLKKVLPPLTEEDIYNWPKLRYTYEPLNSEAKLIWIGDWDITSYVNKYEIFQIDIDNDFFKLMNCYPIPDKDQKMNITLLNNQPCIGEIIFSNVWNRSDLFIHASFVHYSSFNYLGRGGEFYYKPSKIFQFVEGSSQFSINVSFDGCHYVPLPYENFIIELSFIVNTQHYQSE